jgi:hypothetical protein
MARIIRREHSDFQYQKNGRLVTIYVTYTIFFDDGTSRSWNESIGAYYENDD